MTQNSWNSEDPVQVAKGGTGVNTLTTAYGVLCAGTTATGDVQTLGALGASGTLLTSNGAGALPSFQAAAAGGAWEYVSSTTISNDATIQITGFTSSYSYMLWLENITPATDNVTFDWHQSTDGGSSFATWGSGRIISCDGTTVDPDSDGDSWNDSSFATMGNAANENFSGQAILYNPTSAARGYAITAIGYQNTASSLISANGYYTKAPTSDIDSVELFFSAGNLSTGVIRVYRLVQS